MLRLFLVFLGMGLAACSSIDKSMKQQQARFRLSNELSTVEIKGDPVDLTMKLLDEAYTQMESDDATRIFGAMTRFAVGQTPGYRVIVGDRIQSKFSARFMGDGFVWRDKIVDMAVALDSSDIKVEAPIRIFELKNMGGGRFTAWVTEKEGNQGNDIVKIKARMVRALDQDKYRLAVSRVKKQYPEFVWE
ncbi:MAG: hypothetical protein ABL958_07385 [Bdellovibrionia bacterium]